MGNKYVCISTLTITDSGISTKRVVDRYIHFDSLVDTRHLLIVASCEIGAFFVLKYGKNLIPSVPPRI